jgi:hypothetical protein
MVASLSSRSAVSKLTVSWALAVAIAPCLVSGVDAFGADEEKAVEVAGAERIAVLRFLAARNQANYQKIETWRGKYGSIERFPQKLQLAPKSGKPAGDEAGSPPEIEIRDVIAFREGLVEFALEMAGDKLWSDYKENASKARFLLADRKELITPLAYTPAVEKQILTADRLTTLSGHKVYGPLHDQPNDPHHQQNTSSKLAVRNGYRAEERNVDLGLRLDPRRFYYLGSPQPVFEELELYAKSLEGAYGAEAQARTSNLTRITRLGGPGKREYTVTSQFVSGRPEDEKGLDTQNSRFAEESGFLPVEQTYTSGGDRTVLQRRTWVYQRTAGIWIPQSFRFTSVGRGSTSPASERLLTCLEAVLNEELPAETFSVDRLGLAKGDRLVDKVEQSLYVSDGNSLTLVGYSQPPRPASRWAPSLMLGIGACVLALVGAVIWRTFRRRAKSVRQ